jgi:hypothetical protein
MDRGLFYSGGREKSNGIGSGHWFSLRVKLS